MRYRKPEEMKETGIEWVGEVPNDWEDIELRYLYSIDKGNGFDNYYDSENKLDKKLIPYLSMEYLRNKNAEAQFIDSEEDHEPVTEKDSLILWDGSNAGEFIKGKYGALSTTLSKISPIRKVEGSYSFYLLKAIEKRVKDNTVGMGIPHVDPGYLKETKLPIPPTSEQHAISAFLNRKTKAIDALIKKKEQLIERLSEKRQALITQAVTKGLDPHAPMKDSRIEWLGEVPEEWETSKFNFHIKLRHGYQFRESDFTEDGIKVVKITQLNEKGFLDLSKASFIDKDRAKEFGNIHIKNGDILMCLTGGTIGKIIRVSGLDEIAVQNYRVGHFSPKNQNKLSQDYLYYLMSSIIKEQIFFAVRETGQPNIGMDDFSRMKICLPPRIEQENIAQFINENTSKINELIESEYQVVEKLKEYRQSLISAAVTGKIDVRNEEPAATTGSPIIRGNLEQS